MNKYNIKNLPGLDLLSKIYCEKEPNESLSDLANDIKQWWKLFMLIVIAMLETI